MHSHGLTWKHLSRFMCTDHHELHLAFTHCFNLQHTDLWRILGCSLHIYQMEKQMSPLILGWPESLGFSARSQGKTQMNFLANPTLNGNLCLELCWVGKALHVHTSWKGLSPWRGGATGAGPSCLLTLLVLALLHPGLTCQDPRLPLPSSQVFSGGWRQPTEMLRMRRNRERVKGSLGVPQGEVAVPHFSSLLYIQESISQLCLCRWLFTFSLNSQKVPSLQNHVHSHALYVQ